MCVCLCVRPQAIKNHSREMKAEQLVKQVLLLFSFFIIMTPAINTVDGRGLSNEGIMSSCQRRLRQHCISYSFITFYQLYSTNKINYRSKRAVQVAELIKEDWPIVLH